MGITVSKSNDKQDIPDAEYSQLHLSAVFNEAFVNGVFEQLPEYLSDFTALEDDDLSNPAIKQDSEDMCRLRKVMTILGSSLKDENELDSWSIGGTTEKSLFGSNNKKRARLLLRIYQAYNNLLAQYRPTSEREDSLTQVVVPMLPSLSLAVQDSSSDVMGAMSIGMSTSMAKVLGKTNSQLYLSIADTLMGIAGSMKPTFRSFPADSVEGRTGALAKALDSLKELAAEMLECDASEVKSAGLGLMLAVAQVSGSLQETLQVVLLLLREESCVLPARALESFTALIQTVPKYRISLPARKNAVNEYKLTCLPPLQDCDRTRLREHPGLCSLATDGTALYTYQSLSTGASLTKSGTGMHGTLVGDALAFVPDVKALIRDFRLNAQALDLVTCDACEAAAEESWESHTIETAVPVPAVVYPSFFPAGAVAGMRHHHITDIAPFTVGTDHSTIASTGRCGCYLDMPFDFRDVSARGSVVVALERGTVGNYWEFTVLSLGTQAEEGEEEPGIVAIGFAATESYAVNSTRVVGWDQHSFGYHSDDGNIFVDGETTEESPSYSEGDIVGCGLEVREDDVTLYFTNNGTRLSELRVPLGQEFYPVVTMQGAGCEVCVNTGAQPFSYQGAEVKVKSRNHAGVKTVDVPLANSLVGTVAVCRSHVLLRLKGACLASTEFVVLTPALTVESILDVGSVLAAEQLTTTEPFRESKSEFFFALQDRIDVRATGGRRIRIISGFWKFTAGRDQQMDVVVVLTPFLQSDNTMLVSEACLQEALDGRIPSGAYGFTLRCRIEDLSSAERLEAEKRDVQKSLCLPFAAAGNVVVCLQAPPDRPPVGCFCPTQSLSVLSAVRGEASLTSLPAEALADAVTEVWRRHWVAFLQRSAFPAPDQADCDSAELWAELGALEVQGATDFYTLSFQARRLGEAFQWKEVFPVGEAPNFRRTLAALEGYLFPNLARPVVATVMELTDSVQLKVVKQVTLNLSSGDEANRFHREDFEKKNMLFNGARLRIFTPTDLRRTWQFDLRSDSAEAVGGDSMGWQAVSLDDKAVHFARDMRNHCMWAWNPITCSSVLWRNRVASVPSWKFTVEQFQSRAERKGKLSSIAYQRMEELQDPSCPQTASRAVALLLTMLEHQAQPYGPTDWEAEVAGAEQLFRVRLICQHSSPSSKTPNLSIIFRGNKADLMAPKNDNQTVFNLVTLDANFDNPRAQEFLVGDSEHHVRRLMEALENISPGTMVLVAAAEIPSRTMRAVSRAFSPIGLEHLDEATNNRSILVIGRKGMSAGTALCSFGKSGENVSLECTLPLRTVPVALELTADTMQALLNTLQALYDKFIAAASANSASVSLCKMSILSTVQLLKVHMFRISLAPADEAKALLSFEWAVSMRDLLGKLIHSSELLQDRPVEDAILGLFVSAVGVLYPSLQDLQALLFRYMEQYTRGSITPTEMIILELVLKKITEPGPLVQLLRQDDQRTTVCNAEDSAAKALNFLVSLQNIFLGEFKRTLALPTRPQNGVVGRGKISTTVVTAMEAFCKLLLVQGADAFVDDRVQPEENRRQGRQAGAQMLVKTVVAIVRQCQEVLEAVVTHSSAVFYDEMLLQSPVHTLLPLALNVLSNLAACHCYDFIHPVIDSVAELVSTLSGLHSALRGAVKQLPITDCVYSDKVVESAPACQVVESEHPYRSNMDEEIELTFPGATSISIAFDSQTRTENGCDYVQFRDIHGNSLHGDRYTGRDGSQNWPGFGGRPPLVTENSTVLVYFHTDGSVEDWGYRFTVTPTYPPKPNTGTHSTHWLVRLEFELAQCTAALASVLVTGQPWQESLETPNAAWMHNPLVRPELFRWEASAEDSEDALLRGLIDRQEGSLSEKFARIMRACVREDQGSVEVIHRAVYAACGAIIKCNGLAKDAFKVATGATKTVPVTLAKAWRAGQKLRALLSAHTPTMTMQESGERNANAEDATDAAHLRDLSDAIVERALFLLRSPVTVEGTTSAVVESRALIPPLSPASASLHPYALQQPSRDSSPSKTDQLGPPLPSASTTQSGLRSPDIAPAETPSSGREAEGLERIPMQRQFSADTRNVSNLWHSLVEDEAVVGKLKKLLENRKRLVATSHRKHEQSVTDKVLAFVQSTVSVGQLEEVNALRNKRAILRAKGLDVFADLLVDCSHPFALTLVVKALRRSLQGYKRGEDETSATGSRRHFLNAVEGCSPEQAGLVWQKFASLMRVLVCSLNRGRQEVVSLPLTPVGVDRTMRSHAEAWEQAVVACLRCCAIDFDAVDHSMVSESGLLLELRALLESPSSIVASAAEGLFEGLVSRCLHPAGDIVNGTGKPVEHAGGVQDLTRPLLETMLQRVVSATAQAVPTQEDAVIVVPCCRFQPGSVGPLNTLRSCLTTESQGGVHSYSMWIKRPYSSLLDGTTPSQLSIEGSGSTQTSAAEAAGLALGAQVIPGPNFDFQSSEFGGSWDTVGTVSKPLGTDKMLSVLWPNGKTTKCTYNPPSKVQVVRADPAVGGHVFSVGTPGVLESNQAQAVEGLIMLPDATLRLISTKPNINAGERDVCRVPPNQWVHIAVTVSLQGSTLWINGKSAEVLAQTEGAHMSHMPLYLGQVPFASSSPSSTQLLGAATITDASTVLGWNGVLAALTILQDAVNGDQIEQLMKSSKEAVHKSSQVWNDGPLLSILAVLKKGMTNLRDHQDSSVVAALSQPQLLDAVFSVLSAGTALSKCYMYRICASIFPLLEVGVVQGAAERCKGYLGSSSSFLESLLDSVGRSCNVWGLEVAGGEVVDTLRVCGDAQYGVAMAQLALLRTFAVAPDNPVGSAWKGELARCLKNVLSQARKTVDNLAARAHLEMKHACAPSPHDASADPVGAVRCNRMYAILALLGGDFPVLHVGAQGVYVDEVSGTREDCVVLGYSAVPDVDVKANKAEATKWKSAAVFGDAVAIMVLSNMGVPLVVHKDSLEFAHLPTSNSGTDRQLSQFLEEHVGADRISQLFALLANVNCTDLRPIPQPRTVQVVEELVFESPHPRVPSSDLYRAISIPGAVDLTVTFDPRSETSRREYCVFFKDRSRTEAWGTRYTGSDTEGSWCGVRDNPPLRIPGSTTEFKFHASSSSEEHWGYKFTVTGTVMKEIFPPGLPTLPHFALLAHIKMLGMKALRFSLAHCSWLLPRALGLFRGLIQSALAPAPETPALPVAAATASTLTFESNHPYENSLDVYTPVCIPGAKRLSVVFDPETRTESNCDFVELYTDSSHSARVPGTEKYTGGKDGGNSNWPGLGDRPGLVIDGDSFEIYFHTDGSVNDWGYRMFVTADFGAPAACSSSGYYRGAHASPAIAAERCFYLQQYLLDGAYRAKPFSADDAVQYTCMPARTRCREFIDATLVEELNVQSGQKAAVGEGVEKKAEQPQVPSANAYEDSEGGQALPVGANGKVRINQAYKVSLPMGYQVVETAGVDLLRELPRETGSQQEEGYSSEDVLVRLPYTARLLALEERGNYLKVQYWGLPVVKEGDHQKPVQKEPSSQSSPMDDVGNALTQSERSMMEGWVCRWASRNIDKELLRADCSVAGSVLPIKLHRFPVSLAPDPTPDDGRCANTDSSKDTGATARPTKPIRHPMYSVTNSSDIGAEHGSLNSDAFLRAQQRLSQSKLIGSETLTLEPALVEYSEIAALGYSFEAVAFVLANWPVDEVLSVGHFGSLSNLLTFMNISLVRQSVDGSCIAHRKLWEVLRCSEQLEETCAPASVSPALIAFASEHLRELVQSGQTTSSLKPALPAPACRACETSVLLPQGGGSQTLSFPNAVRWEILTPTYTGEILVTAQPTSPLQEATTMRLTDGTVQTLHLQGTEAVTVTWTPRSQSPVPTGPATSTSIHVTVIFTEADAAEVAAYQAEATALRQRCTQSREKAFSSQLACWILHTYVTENSSQWRNLLYGVSTFTVLREFYESRMSDAVRAELTELFVAFLGAFRSHYTVLPEDLLRELCALKRALSKSADREHRLQTLVGYKTHIKPALQATVQLILSLDLCISPPLLPSPSEMESDSLLEKEVCTSANWVERSASWGPGCIFSADSEAVGSDTSLPSWTMLVPADCCAEEGGQEVAFGVCCRSTIGAERFIGYSTRGQVLCGQAADCVALYPSGHQYPLHSGDLLSVTVNRTDRTVICSLNGVPLHVLLGPPGADAVLELDWVPEDAVPSIYSHLPRARDHLPQLTENPETLYMHLPSLLSSSGNSQSINTLPQEDIVALKTSDWLEKVIAANSLLHSIENRSLPRFVVKNLFLPMATLRVCKELVMGPKDFSGVAAGSMLSRTVSVPGASALRICLNSSYLVAGDLLEVLDGQGVVIASVVSQGAQLAQRIRDLPVLVKKVIERAEKKASDLDVHTGRRMLPLLCSGDVVVRGPAWNQGNADGGAGALGVVLTQKQGLLDTAVAVKWERSGNQGIAKYTPSRREVLLLRRAPARLLDSDSGIDVSGDTLTMRVTKLISSDASVERRLSVVVVPILPIKTCLRSKENCALLQHFRQLYVPNEGSKGLEGDLALVRHIDSIAAAKKFTQYDLVKKSWTQLQPSAEDLTRSPALKALFDETVASLPQDCGVTLSDFSSVNSAKEDKRVSFAPQVRAIMSSLSGKGGSDSATAAVAAERSPGQIDAQQGDTAARNDTAEGEVEMPVCKKCIRVVFRHPLGTWSGGWSCDWPQHQGRNLFGGSDYVYGCADAVLCNWGMCHVCFERCEAAFRAQRDQPIQNESLHETSASVSASAGPSPIILSEPACAASHLQAGTHQRPRAWNGALLADSAEDVQSQVPSTAVGQVGGASRCPLAHHSIFGSTRSQRSPLSSAPTATPLSESTGAIISLEAAPPIVSEVPPSVFIAASDATFSLSPSPLRSALTSQSPVVPFDTPVFRVGRMSHSSRSSSDDEENSTESSDNEDNSTESSDDEENSSENSGGNDTDDNSDQFWSGDDDDEEGEVEEEEEEHGWDTEEEEEEQEQMEASSGPVAIVPTSAAEEQEQLMRAIAASLASPGGYITEPDATCPAPVMESGLSEETVHSETEIAPEMPVCKKCRREIFRHPPGTWNNGWTCDWPQHQGRNNFRASDSVYGCVGVKPCNWGMCHACFERCEAEFHSQRNRPTHDILREVAQKSTAEKPIQAHFAMIQLLNQLFQATLPFTDLSLFSPAPGSLAYLFKKHRGLIFEVVKMAPISSALDSTAATSTSTFDLTLSRSRARKHQQAGLPDKDARFTVFAQAFRVIHGMPPAQLRRADKLYNTKFMGEHAVDGGGPYRESFGTYMQELQSGAMSLLVRTQNGRQGIGQNREKWLLNPGACSPLELEMLAFLGKLMGIAIRSKEYLALHLPSLIWKLLAGDSPDVEDLEKVDSSQMRSLDLLRHLPACDAAAFSRIFCETFTATSSDDRTVELLPEGAHRDMTYETRHEYCDLVTNYRLHEFDAQAAAIRRGLATIVPLSLMSLLTWHQLESLVCGKEDVDVELLQSVTDYSSCSASDTHIRNFWQIMREFTNEERSALLRFTWGRSRLPLTAADFPQRFKLQSFNKRPADAYYPVAHTCFFSLELPKYSSLELMREKLRYAIFNCEAIDGDDTTSGDAIAALGWEE